MQATAARIKGSKATVMEGIGHFPMSENRIVPKFSPSGAGRDLQRKKTKCLIYGTLSLFFDIMKFEPGDWVSPRD